MKSLFVDRIQFFSIVFSLAIFFIFSLVMTSFRKPLRSGRGKGGTR
jgi:hypothetical protein